MESSWNGIFSDRPTTYPVFSLTPTETGHMGRQRILRHLGKRRKGLFFFGRELWELSGHFMVQVSFSSQAAAKGIQFHKERIFVLRAKMMKEPFYAQIYLWELMDFLVFKNLDPKKTSDLKTMWLTLKNNPQKSPTSPTARTCHTEDNLHGIHRPTWPKSCRTFSPKRAEIFFNRKLEKHKWLYLLCSNFHSLLLFKKMQQRALGDAGRVELMPQNGEQIC